MKLIKIVKAVKGERAKGWLLAVPVAYFTRKKDALAELEGSQRTFNAGATETFEVSFS